MIVKPALVTMGVMGLAAVFAPALGAAAAESSALCAFRSDFYANAENLDNDANHERDIAVGVPRSGSGAVDIAFNPGHDGQRLHVDQSYFDNVAPAGAHDRFGAAVAYGTFPEQADGSTDACFDLAIGAPGSDDATGSVLLVHGSTTGLRHTDAIRLVGATRGEHFGAAIATSGPDVFVAAPDRTVAGQQHAGAVDHFVVRADGTAQRVGVITQAAAGIPGGAEPGDQFGRTLAVSGTVLYIGDPDESIGTATDAGTVTAVWFDQHKQAVLGTKLLYSQIGNALGGFRAGDRFGAALATPSEGAVGDVVVGLPGATVNGHAAAGAVQLFASDTGGASFLAHLLARRTVTQDSAGVPGASESGDRFGTSVALTSFQDCFGSDPYGIAVGSPGESLGSIRAAGSVTIVAAADPGGRAQQPACQHAWYQGFAGAGGLGGVARTGDALGTTVGDALPWTFGEFDSESHSAPGFVIGVPGANVTQVVDAGAMIVLEPWGTPTHLALADSAGPSPGERYGEVRTN